MTATPVLVVNADDFGASDGVNAGIVQAHEQGIVTSASLMVRGPAADAAAAYARDSRLSVGLHLDLGEWAFVDGEWEAQYEVVDTSDPDAVTKELRAQLEAFGDLVGRPPTHLDSHQHVHRDDPVRSALRSAAWPLQVAVRHNGIRYNGGFYGQDDKGRPRHEAITVDAMVALLEDLTDSVTEIACHPAATVDLDTMYAAERLTELATLCDPRLRDVITSRGIILCGFGDLRAFLA